MSHSGGVSSVCPLSSLHLWLQSSVCSLRRAVWHHIQNGRGAQCMLRENTHNNTLPEATFALCYSLGTVSLFWPKCYSFVHSLHKAGQTLVINKLLVNRNRGEHFKRPALEWMHSDSDSLSASHSCLEFPQYSSPGRMLFKVLCFPWIELDSLGFLQFLSE